MRLKFRSPQFRTRRGDTLLEVAFAIAVFSLISVIAINIMDSSVSSSQANLEITMARNEIDAQAEALRFIHNSFLAEREVACDASAADEECVDEKRTYTPLWFKLTRTDSDPYVANGLANNSDEINLFDYNTCEEAYNSTDSIFANKAFVLNTRYINPYDVTNTILASQSNRDKFTPAILYPRLIFSQTSTSPNSDEIIYESATLADGEGGETIADINPDDLYRYVVRAEGLWVISVRHKPSTSEIAATGNASTPEYFDFHINTCWYAPGKKTPSTIGTIIRLYNPEYVEAAK